MMGTRSRTAAQACLPNEAAVKEEAGTEENLSRTSGDAVNSGTALSKSDVDNMATKLRTALHKSGTLEPECSLMELDNSVQPQCNKCATSRIRQKPAVRHVTFRCSFCPRRFATQCVRNDHEMSHLPEPEEKPATPDVPKECGCATSCMCRSPFKKEGVAKLSTVVGLILGMKAKELEAQKSAV